MDKGILRELGLTGNEIDVYLALLRSGSITANGLSQKTGMHRQAVYDALDRLLEKQFVNYAVEDHKKNFRAVSPEVILDYLKERESRFRGLLPELEAMANLAGQETNVEVFRGKSVVRTLYKRIISEFEKARGEVLISGVDERKFIDEDRLALEQHLKKLQVLNCMERVLVMEGDANFVEGPQTSYKWTPRQSFSPTPIFVFNDHIAMLVWGEPNHLIIIQNNALADAYRKQFNLLWESALDIKR